MLGRLVAFVDELRQVGVPVSMVEAIDAADALRHVDLSRPEAVESALAATLVKHAEHVVPFRVAFEVFFGKGTPPDGAEPDAEGDGHPRREGGSGGTGGGGSGGDDPAALAAAIADALTSGDTAMLRRLVASAVTGLAGLEPGRPVGGRYYVYRVLRRLDIDALRQTLTEREVPAGGDVLSRRLAAERVAELLDLLEGAVRREVTRRLVADRGAEDVARTLRVPLTEDLDLMHATREELARIELAVAPLARKLATRLAHRRRRGRRGRLDVRRTIRRSLAHGGALVEPRFRPPRRSKPEIVLLCDVSGSMATFARFTMQLTFAIGNEFSRVRSFAFIDGLDEVTRWFGPGADFQAAMTDMGRTARLVKGDGHSDYGSALREFTERYPGAVTPRTTLIVAGDARNNYRPTGDEFLAAVGAQARALYWLNPESRRFWNTGDSVMSAYERHCDEVYEVRTLRHLERFVAEVALPVPAVRRARFAVHADAAQDAGLPDR